MLDTSDTVRGGPVVLGPGVGAVMPFAHRFALAGEIRMLFGVPDFASIVEALLGVQYDISGP
jgi:hypothetical protein